MIARISGVEVADVLKGRERESNYRAKRSAVSLDNKQGKKDACRTKWSKKEGHPLKASEMGLYLADKLPSEKLLIVIDNVSDTGATAFAAASCLGSCVVLTNAMTDELF